MEESLNNISLLDLKNGEKAVITQVGGNGAFRKRILEMGFVKGKTVTAIKNAPLQDPVEYEIMGYNLSLRHSEAHLIGIAPVGKFAIPERIKYEGVVMDEEVNKATAEKNDTIKVALVGNPNSGKTTFFNHASGSRERVGNYGGVTIDIKEATIKHPKYKIRITDLPGTYSITEYTPEELFVRTHILQNKPDVVVNVIDASNPERNLYLTTQLIDMNIKVVIALNMYDELGKKGITLDHAALGKMLGIPVVPTVAVKGEGIPGLVSKIVDVYEDKDPDARHIHINYGNMIEGSIARVQALLKRHENGSGDLSARYQAIKLLEDDKPTRDRLKTHPGYAEIEKAATAEIQTLEKEYKEKPETIFADARYGFIAGALTETCDVGLEKAPGKKIDIDHVLTHKYWGFPIFFFFMWLMFQATFTLGGYPMEWIDAGMGYLGGLTGEYLPEGAVRDLIVDGIIGGVGGVIIFLPNILILFFFISLMEDTGYMSRVAFIMDKLMHKIGLHGKSFIPLLTGFGCNVPAVMATRTLENRKDRIMTMLITPFMSCSARLPVYVLIISAFFPAYQGLVLFSVYIFGILLAVGVALFLKRTVFAKQDVPYVMELPPYRMPTLKNTSKHMWFKGSQYIRKMGTVILVASILIWALSYYPQHVENGADYQARIETLNAGNRAADPEMKRQIAGLELKIANEQQANSYIGRLGKFIEPAIRPLGFDWKIGASIITGLAAKEIVVSSMGVLYQADLAADENSGSLIEKLQDQEHSSGVLEGRKVFTPLVAFGFMLFILIYFPCIAVVAAIKKEASLGWAVFTMFYTTALAWLVAFATYQIGSLFI